MPNSETRRYDDDGNVIEKCCSKCGDWKSLGEYHRDKRQPDGYKYKCKVCTLAESKSKKQSPRKILPPPTITNGEVTHKHCYRCEQLLPVSAFTRNKARFDGYEAACRTCRGVKTVKYKAPPPKIDERGRIIAKHCTKCKTEKRITEFNFESGTKDGYSVWCVDCKRAKGGHEKQTPTKWYPIPYELYCQVWESMQPRESRVRRRLRIKYQTERQRIETEMYCWLLCQVIVKLQNSPKLWAPRTVERLLWDVYGEKQPTGHMSQPSSDLLYQSWRAWQINTNEGEWRHQKSLNPYENGKRMVKWNRTMIPLSKFESEDGTEFLEWFGGVEALDEYIGDESPLDHLDEINSIAAMITD